MDVLKSEVKIEQDATVRGALGGGRCQVGVKYGSGVKDASDV